MKRILRVLMFALIAISLVITLIAFPAMAMAASGSGDPSGGLAYSIAAGVDRSPLMQTIIVISMLVWVGWFIKHRSTLLRIATVADGAFYHAEAVGLKTDLTGYQKLQPFMERFVDDYRILFKKWPMPYVMAYAVKVMEDKVFERYNEKNE